MSDTNSPSYRPGDVVNGHRLIVQPDGSLAWVPLEPPTSEQKKSRKVLWITLGAVGAAVLLLIVIAVVVIGVGLATAGRPGVDADDKPAVAEETEQAVDEEAEPAAEVQDPVVAETGFGMDPDTGTYWYAVIVDNPNPDDVFAAAAISVEAVDAAGVILDSDSQYTTLLSGRTILAGSFFSVNGTIDHLEVRGPTASAATHSPAAETGAFTVSELAATPEYDWAKVSGKVSSTFSDDQNLVRINVIARDANGTIIGSNTAFVDRVPAGGAAAWEIGFWTVPVDSTFEVTATL